MNPLHKKIFERKYGQQDDQIDSNIPSQPAYDNNVSAPQTYSSTNVLSPGLRPNNQDESLRSFLNQFNSSKLCLRPSSDYFPNTKKTQKSTSVPLSFTILPYPTIFTPEEFPIASYGHTSAVIRCDDCRAYINPFTEFIEGGNRFKCNLCGATNNTPSSYHSPLDLAGNREDRYQRPELYNGLFDIKAGSDYMARSPMPPIYFFVIDVSQKGIENGSIEILTNVLHEFVTNDWFWGDVRTKIGFLLFDTNVHLINLSPKLRRPGLITLTDIDNLARLPIFDNLLVNLSESKPAVESLLKSLPKMFAHTKDAGSNLFSGVRVAASILRRSGGRIYVLQNSSSVLNEASVSIKTTLEAKDKKTLTFPTSSRLMELTPDMQQHFISCNMFIFSNEYRNAVTLGELARHLNGDLYYYTEGSERNYKFYYDLRNSLLREYTWESVFRVRASAGWKITNKYGNYSVKASGDLLSVPNVDGYKGLVYEVELDSDVAKNKALYLQSALLYTTSQGERRIRVINYGIPLTSEISDVHANIDPQAIVCTLLRRTLEQLYLNPSLHAVREGFLTSARQIFTEVTRSKGKQEDLSESLVTFSMAVLGTLKHPIFLDNTWQLNTEADKMNVLRIKLNMLTIDETMLYFVPYLFAIHSLSEEDASYYDETGAFVYPQLLNLSLASLTNTGVYLMDAGDALYMLIGSQTAPATLNSLFGIETLDGVGILTEDMMSQNQEDSLVVKVLNLLNELRVRKTDNYAYLHIFIEGGKTPAEYKFYSKLIEDKANVPNSYNISYADFMNILSKPVIGNQS